MKRALTLSLIVLMLSLLAVTVQAQGSPLPTAAPTATSEPPALPDPPTADALTLVAALSWLMSGGSGWVVSRIFEDDKAPAWFGDLKPSQKQFVTALSSGLLALTGCLGLMLFGQLDIPLGFEQWFNVLAPVFVAAPGVGELFHSRRKVTQS